MPEVVTAALVGGAVLGGASASEQASANRDAANQVMSLAQQFGQGTLDQLDTMDYDPVELMSLLGDAEEIVDFGFDQSREKAYGEENIEAVDALQREALDRSRFDFSSLPADMLDAMDDSTLARTAGGPAGQAENISLQNRISLAESGFNQFNSLASNNAQFTPNPVGTLFDLGKFRTAQQQTDLDFDMQKLRQELAIEEFRFNAMTGAIQQKAANDAGAVNLGAASNVLTSVGQGFSSSGLSSATSGAGSQMQGTSSSLISSITGR